MPGHTSVSDPIGARSTTAASRLMLGAISGLAVLSIALAGAARTTGVGASRISVPDSGVSVDLRFEDASAGAIRVLDTTGARAPIVVPPGQDGFIRVALRSLARDRLTDGGGAGSEIAFRLGRTADGRLWLRDLATGRVLYLDAYGHENARSFARLLDPPSPPSSRSNDR